MARFGNAMENEYRVRDEMTKLYKRKVESNNNSEEIMYIDSVCCKIG